MFNRKKAKDANPLDEAIAEVYSNMAGFTPDADEYAQMADQLTKLYALKEIENNSWWQRTSPDAVIAASANLLAVGIVVGYEHNHIITTKVPQLLRMIVR